MKQSETVFKAKKKYVMMMVLCFLYGGFAILTTMFLVYNDFVRPELAPSQFFQARMVGLNNQDNKDLNQFNRSNPNERFSDDFNQRQRSFREPFNPIRFISSPLLLVIFISGLISFGGGITIWSLVREKEIKSIKQETTSNLLLPDEKMVIDSLKKSGFESTQSRLVKETGLNKVQVHRVIKRLESKGLLEKHEYGLTNKIVLKQEFFE